jgi:hypothetical protein
MMNCWYGGGGDMSDICMCVSEDKYGGAKTVKFLKSGLSFFGFFFLPPKFGAYLSSGTLSGRF